MIPEGILATARKRAKVHGTSMYLIETPYGWKVACFASNPYKRTILRVTRKGKVKAK